MCCQSVLSIAAILFAGVCSLLALAVLYLLVLTCACLVPRRRLTKLAPPRTRFAVLIPAHDEASVIARALFSLQRVDYPFDLFDVHVVADNCQDCTAEIARRFQFPLNVVVHERRDDSKRSKGYALEWLIDRLRDETGYDAYVMLDADWTVSPNLLDVLNTYLQSGAEIVQVSCRVARPEDSWLASLRCVAFSLVNHVRPLGSNRLGLSCGLKGTGMAFTGKLLRERGWHSYSLIEDTEQHISLLIDGYHVVFAPETFIESDQPPTLRAARNQNLRWESGKLALARDYTLPLLRAGLRTGNASLIAEVFALLVPPLSILTILCCGTLGATWLLGFEALRLLSLALVGGLALHVVVGLAMVRPPPTVYLALLLAPLFILWKLRIYVIALGQRGRGPWVRTSRPGEVFR